MLSSGKINSKAETGRHDAQSYIFKVETRGLHICDLSPQKVSLDWFLSIAFEHSVAFSSVQMECYLIVSL